MMTTNNKKLVSVQVGDTILFTYKNWEGKTSKRKAVVKGFVFGSNEYHPEPQFMLEGFDLDKSAMRTFATKDIYELEIVEKE